MQPDFPGPFAIREVGAKWTDRRAPAKTDSDADRRVERAGLVESIADIDENGAAEAIGDPARKFRARDGHVAATDDRVALRNSDRFVRIPAKRLVAARAEQE